MYFERDERIRFVDQFALLIENWKLVVFTSFLVFMAGLAYAYLTPPTYRADAIIQVEPDGPSSGDRGREQVGQLEAIFNSRGKTNADTEMELMRSRLVVAQTVRKLNLDIVATPRYFPVFGTRWASRSQPGDLASPILGLSQFAWGGEKIEVSRFDVPRSLENVQFTLIAKGNNQFDLMNGNGVRFATGVVGTPLHVTSASGPIDLKVDTLISQPGCEFRLTRASTLETITALQEALFIAERTKETGVVSMSLDGHNPAHIAKVVNTVANEYIQQNIQRRSAEAQHSLDFLQGQLPVLRTELERSEQQYNEFRNSKGTVDLSEEGKTLVKQVADERAKEVTLMQQRAELTQRFTASAASVNALDEQIAILRQEQGSLAQRVSRLPDTEQQALRLERDVRVNSELYTNLLNSAQQLRVIEAGQIGSVRLVDTAMTPEKPIKPKRTLIMFGSALLGLILGAVAARVRSALRDEADRSVEIERVSGIPVFAVVPRSARQAYIERRVRRGREVERVLAMNAPQDTAVESLRVLRTALDGNGAPVALGAGGVVMITGTRPGAGKSFLSVNFAAVSAVAGRRVLLVDGDMRCGDLHAQFKLGYRAGLSDALAGQEVTGLIVHDVMPGVDLLTRGLINAAPDHLLLGGAAQEIFDTLARAYDIVIVDTPPVLAVTDASLLGKFAKTTLLVVRHGSHSFEEIAESKKRLGQVGVAVSGILVTDVRQTSYGYASGYAKYYTSQHGVLGQARA
ncbi:polysaccharide biosynthesis tyrosine autokinase [Paraburkholderia xenovorans]|uniref:polysaccharide biosynthesis tyrosine autokinase n=1 Tax=Paraburkholderia xenovorans TaxID=36873 RepID=UPI0038B9A505